MGTDKTGYDLHAEVLNLSTKPILNMRTFSKRFIFFGWSILLLGLLLTACQASTQRTSSESIVQTDNSPETVVQTDNSPETENSPETVVRTLYQNFSLANESIVDQKKEILSNYFDTELVNLILQDRICAEQTGGICNLDFDILYNTQDPLISELQIGTFDSVQQTITVTFKNDNVPQSIIYQMKNTPSGWRIADIRYSDEVSLKSILSEH